MIPKEAIEAVAHALHDGGEQSWLAWDDVVPFGQEAYRVQARTLLEAAEPHMLAVAWDAGLAKGGDVAAWAIGGRPEEERPNTNNPYRTTTNKEAT